MLKGTVSILFILVSCLWAAPKVAKVSYVEGKAFLFVKESKKKIKIGLVLKQGYTLKTESNSRLEITYLNGDVVRLDQNSEITLEGQPDKGKPKLQKGKLWNNIKKLAKGNPDFKVSTNVATAAVRGTIFQVEASDSTASVHLFDGKVDVGPNKAPERDTNSWGPPAEISGPAEVSMTTWVSLDPGQMINVNWDGSYKADKFKEDDLDQAWLKFNQKRDAELTKQKR